MFFIQRPCINGPVSTLSMATQPENPLDLSGQKHSLPRSFKDLTPSNHFNPRTFFYEMVWKAWLTKRTGQHRRPVFPKLSRGRVALTWIGHASFLVQFTDLNVLIDPNFANWLFLLKRIKRPGFKLRDLPPIDLVLLTHAHFDHFHKPTLRRLPAPKIGVMPWGVGDLARGLGFTRVIELQTWESFSHGDWKVTLTPCKHWGRERCGTNIAGTGDLFWSTRSAGFSTPATALISTASRKSAGGWRRRSRCCPSALIIRIHFATCTWGRTRR